MNPRKPNEPTDQLIEHYHQIDDAEPSLEIDQAILNYAKSSTRKPERWVWPVSIAAGLLLTVGFFTKMGSIPSSIERDDFAYEQSQPNVDSYEPGSTNSSELQQTHVNARPETQSIGMAAPTIEPDQSQTLRRRSDAVNNNLPSANNDETFIAEENKIITTNPTSKTKVSAVDIEPQNPSLQSVQKPKASMPAADSFIVGTDNEVTQQEITDITVSNEIDQAVELAARSRNQSRIITATPRTLSSSAPSTDHNNDTQADGPAELSERTDSQSTEEDYRVLLTKAFQENDGKKFQQLYRLTLKKFPQFELSKDILTWANEQKLDLINDENPPSG